MKKTKSLFILALSIPFITVACSPTQTTVQTSSVNTNLSNPTNPTTNSSTTPSNNTSSPNINTIETIKTNFQNTKSFKELEKVVDLINSLPVNNTEKQERLKTLENIIKLLDVNNLNTDHQQRILNSLDELVIYTPPLEAPTPTPQEPNISQDVINTFISNVQGVRPKGQNWRRFKDGKRVVEDQYEFDKPTDELSFFTTKFGGGGSRVITDLPDGLKQNNTAGVRDITTVTPKYDDSIIQLAKKADQPLPQNAFYRNFVTPDKDNNNKLHIPETTNSPSYPALETDEVGNVLQGAPGRFGLPRKLVNEDYQNLTDSAISLTILNGGLNIELDGQPGKFKDVYKEPNEIVHFLKPYRGTVNIIDYKLEEGQKYPLTWYFITNAHVANRLYLANDKGNGIYGRDESVYNTYNRQYNTKAIVLTKLKSNTPLYTNLPTTSETGIIQTESGNVNKFDHFYDNVRIQVRNQNDIPNDGQIETSFNTKIDDRRIQPSDKLNVRTIVIGTNPFKTNIGDFTDQQLWKNHQELLDFAVLEITFDNEESAKKITEPWYNKNKDKKGEIITSDTNLLDKQQYTNLPVNKFYTLGFPLTEAEVNARTLDEFNNKSAYESRKSSVSPWINKPTRFANEARISEEDKKRLQGGGDLSWSRSYRSFVNTPGVSDVFITLPFLDEGTIKIQKFNEDTKKFANTGYILYGLSTNLDNIAAGGGISGSGVYKDNKLYGLIFAGDPRASTTLALNLRSYGYDYQGYYGSYNLPKYDLIYGSGEQQTKSYYDALKSLYGDEYKTKLFPNGLSTRVDVFNEKK